MDTSPKGFVIGETLRTRLQLTAVVPEQSLACVSHKMFGIFQNPARLSWQIAWCVILGSQ
jgi:hypothetical protein